MKFRLAVAALCAAGIAVPAFAGDMEDVNAVVAKAQKAYNTCDGDMLASLTHADSFDFNPDGTLSEHGDVGQMKANCEAGTKYDFHFNVLKTYVRGSMAVVAHTVTGTVTPKDGEAQKTDAHVTVVLLKDGDAWKAVHVHISPNMSQGGGE